MKNANDPDAESRKYTVYIHIFPDGKRYIGATRQPLIKRWRNGRGYKNQKRLFNAITSSGWDNIEHIIVGENLSEDTAQNLERKLIAEYKTQDENFGYNTKNGGQVFDKHSDEFISSLKERMTGNTYCVGRKLSQKHINALIASNKGKHRPSKHKGECFLSEETIGRIRDASITRWKDPEYRQRMKENHPSVKGENNPMFGKHHTEETKEKIRQKALGRKVSEARRLQMSEKAHKRKVTCYSQNMEFVKSYNSIKEAAEDVGAVATNICFCCKNKNRTAKGYYWRYSDDNN